MSRGAPGGLPSPYKGLMPYAEEDAQFFFGREAEREIISANLLAARLTLLYGASGVGKSSVLRAGVARHLREQARRNLAERGAPEFAVVVFSSWRDDPLAGLAERVRDSVAQVLDGRAVPPVPPSRSLAETLRAWSERVEGDLLLILDQFEEYFLYHGQEDGEGTFAVEFPRAVNQADLRLSVLVSIREDALARLDRFKGRIPNLFDNYLRIEHLDREAARAAIERPVEQYNRLHAAAGEAVRLEPGLVSAVLEQVHTGQVVLGEGGQGVVRSAAGLSPAEARIETPYLQLVLTRLWEEETGGGSRVLRQETLTRLGGAARIVRTHLDAAVAALPPAEQECAARVFHHLVTPSGTKIAHSVPDLAKYAALPEEELRTVLETLAGPEIRILRPVAPPPGQASGTRYEIFHDVLAPAVLDWRRRHVERQERERVRQEEEARRLEEHTERERLRALERARRLRWGVAGLSVLLVVLAGLLLFALQKRDEAMRAQAEANRLKELAQQRLERIVEGIRLKQAVLSGDPNQATAALQSPLATQQIVFGARATPQNYRDATGRRIYRFELFPRSASIPGGLDSIALITYKMDHPTFRNSLMATGRDREFTASYDGWGCLRQVIAVIEYTDPDRAPAITSFDMCQALGW